MPVNLAPSEKKSLKLLPFLRQATLEDEATERFLTGLRSNLLAAVLAGQSVDREVLAALSAFCRDCEFVFAESDAERARLRELRPDLSEVHRLMLACYRDDGSRVLPLDEVRELRPVADRTSVAVASQYEENPYPRWRTLPETSAMADTGAMLIAGCGTGREALVQARIYPNADFFAIDLSRASLAYAIAKAREYAVTNIAFLRADILDVALLGRTFDRIWCTGVLHHMAEPLKGVLALKAVLKPTGILNVKVYSRISRRGILEAIRLRKERDIPPTPDAIRQFRQMLLQLPADHPARGATGSKDFYSISGTRDLLFHVQESNYTVKEAARLLTDAGLRLHRVDHGAKSTARFQAMGFADSLDLDAWERVEQARPEALSDMISMSAGF
jgi:SAM-dependent methyltransferase